TKTGCYVDMTFPSAPNVAQPPIVNRIYYARDVPGQSRSHERGRPLGETAPSPDELLLIQGPLLFDWHRRKLGILPRLENGCLQATQPPNLARVEAWLRARVQATQRPDWVFAKLHCHGAPEDAHATLLGTPMTSFHEALARRAQNDPKF